MWPLWEKRPSDLVLKVARLARWDVAVILHRTEIRRPLVHGRLGARTAALRCRDSASVCRREGRCANARAVLVGPCRQPPLGSSPGTSSCRGPVLGLLDGVPPQRGLAVVAVVRAPTMCPSLMKRVAFQIAPVRRRRCWPTCRRAKTATTTVGLQAARSQSVKNRRREHARAAFPTHRVAGAVGVCPFRPRHCKVWRTKW